MNIKIEIATEIDNWNLKKEISIDLISDITQNIISRYKNFNTIREIELSILLTNNTRMLSLNSEFRGIEKATNVLSFQNLMFNTP